ncbi:unnamed protein product [Arctogadus glacialis]
MRRGAVSPKPSSDDAGPSVTGRSPVVRAQEEPQHPRSSRSLSLRVWSRELAEPRSRLGDDEHVGMKSVERCFVSDKRIAVNPTQ